MLSYIGTVEIGHRHREERKRRGDLQAFAYCLKQRRATAGDDAVVLLFVFK
jgi:hypothetical protein